GGPRPQKAFALKGPVDRLDRGRETAVAPSSGSLSSDVIGKGANIDLLTEACLLGFGFEGIVSKRLGSPYRSGRSCTIKRPIGDLSRCSNMRGTSCGYSITSSARASSVGGTVRPSALAVVRLMTRSNLIGCSTGMSPGLAPRRILSTESPTRRNRSVSVGPEDIR